MHKPIKYRVALDPIHHKRLVNISVHSAVGVVCSESRLSFHIKKEFDSDASALAACAALSLAAPLTSIRIRLPPGLRQHAECTFLLSNPVSCLTWFISISDFINAYLFWYFSKCRKVSLNLISFVKIIEKIHEFFLGQNENSKSLWLKPSAEILWVTSFGSAIDLLYELGSRLSSSAVSSIHSHGVDES